ncbi:MAG: hypothetical protein F6K45_19490 [Kamptonema sp. SIO1D9]|nr:hypothetical protein [Kamptonema sp. SIO1D9]
MSGDLSREQNRAMLKWFNKNYRNLRELYRNQYIAYNENGLIAHSEDLSSVLEIAKASGEHFAIYFLPKSTASVHILPIKFRTVVRQDWIPNYQVKLKHNEFEFTASMLVDSGAELSLISYKLGQELGYALADAESTLFAETIGGTVEYVLRNVEMNIDGYDFIAPVAWLQQNLAVEQLLLGREVVFDRFNIEFRQADEEIIFTWRNNS